MAFNFYENKNLYIISSLQTYKISIINLYQEINYIFYTIYCKNYLFIFFNPFFLATRVNKNKYDLVSISVFI